MKSPLRSQRNMNNRKVIFQKINSTPKKVFENSSSSNVSSASTISGKSNFKYSGKELNKLHHITEYMKHNNENTKVGFIKKHFSEEQIISFLFEYEYEKIKCNLLKCLINNEKMDQIALNLFRDIQNEINSIPDMNLNNNIILNKYYDKFRDKIYYDSNIIKEVVYLKYYKNSDSTSLLRKLPIFTEYKKHCFHCSSSALHRCKKNLFSIPNSNYIICKYCQEIYTRDQIECYCNYDKTIFISYEVNYSNNDDSSYFIATSKDGIENEMIKCKKCKGICDLNMKNGKLYCDNCNIEFNNDINAILFNSINLEKLNMEIEYALIMKEKVNDDEIRSNKICDCKGNLYKGIFNMKEILVCDKCNKVKLYKKSRNNLRNSFSNLNKNKVILSNDNLNNEEPKIIQNHPNTSESLYYKIPSIKSNILKKTILTESSNFDYYYKTQNNIQKNITRNYQKNREMKVKIIHTINNSSEHSDLIFSPTKKTIRKMNTDEEKKYKISSNLNMSDYQILKIIGNGSYANIYLVKEIKTNKKYAIKKVIIDGEEDLLKFKKTIEIIQTLCPNNKYSENNIIPIYKYVIKKIDITSYSVYLLMPLANCDWNEKIKNKSTIYDEKSLMKILTSLIKGFSYIQKNKIAHRDIKPANILILNDNEYCITDFGESINVKNDYGSFDIRGTKNYMSPILSKYAGSGIINVKHNIYKSDVYSLGLCFVYAMTKNLNAINDIKKMKDDEIKKFLTKNVLYKNGYSNEFYNILLKMITINENNRYDFIQIENMIMYHY